VGAGVRWPACGLRPPPASTAGEVGRGVGGVRDRQRWLNVRALRARPDPLSGGSHSLGGGGEVPSIEGMEGSF
jgi:hypothetical protein